MPIKVIAFDADDTLWVNEPFFREAEEKFAGLLEDFMPQHAIIKELYRTEIEKIKFRIPVSYKFYVMVMFSVQNP